MTTPHLSVLDGQTYAHLKGNIEHLLLWGPPAEIREGDLILDGLFWVKSKTPGKHDDKYAFTFNIAHLESPALSAGRITLVADQDLQFARPLGFEQWEPHTTDNVTTDLDIDEQTSTETHALKRGDLIGWRDEPHHPRGRVRRVRRVYENGLIQFEDGAYQSHATASWWVFSVEDNQLWPWIDKEDIDPAMHGHFTGKNGDVFVPIEHTSPVMWRYIEPGHKIVFETSECGSAPSADDIDTFESWCEKNDVLPYFAIRTVTSVSDPEVTVSGEIFVEFADDLGPHVADADLYAEVLDRDEA